MTNITSAINGTTRVVCLIGYPVAHSLSPVIHNHAFNSLGLPYCYIPLPVAPAAVHTIVPLFRAAGFAGANITIPHKAALAHYCDRLSPLSEITNTVNTLYWEGSSLCGTTTDSEGFLRAVEAAGHAIAGSHVVILGNGGTARTLSIALGLEGSIASLCIVGRNSERITKLAHSVTRQTGFPVTATQLGTDALANDMQRCTLLVNCTNVGMLPAVDTTPLPAHYLHDGLTVFDAIYNPLQTKLLRDAAAAGCRTENGLRMLLYQGLASFRYWTGVDAPESLFPLDQLHAFIERH